MSFIVLDMNRMLLDCFIFLFIMYFSVQYRSFSMLNIVILLCNYFRFVYLQFLFNIFLLSHMSSRHLSLILRINRQRSLDYKWMTLYGYGNCNILVFNYDWCLCGFKLECFSHSLMHLLANFFLNN